MFERLLKEKEKDKQKIVRLEIAQHRLENTEARQVLAWEMFESIMELDMITVHADDMYQAKSQAPITTTHCAGYISYA